MRELVVPLVVASFLAACSGPAAFDKAGTDGTDDTVDTGTPGDETSENPDEPINSDNTLPPGTSSPSPATGIVRYEAKDSEGNGYARSFTYNSSNDTFLVDGLAFDGANSAYTRGDPVGSLGRFAVYEGPATYLDSVTDVPISQFLHRALYGVSASGEVKLAIVRTGSYVNYGFGGFIYQRNGSVTLPTSGQAAFTGEYAGLRDFKGRGGLEYVRGDMTMEIDFEDFNAGDAVRGAVTNRRVYDIAGNDITASIMTALGSSAAVLPTITFDVGPGVMTENGEITGSVGSFTYDDDSVATGFEQGKYYAIVSGDDPDEVVGIIVTEAADPRGDFTTRETGGFLLTRRWP